MTRYLAAGTLFALGTLLAGCGGGNAAHRIDPSLAVHRGNGFTVGYPKDWKPDPRRKVFRGADFEVLQPDQAGGPPKGSWSVFTDNDVRPLNLLVDAFIAQSKTAGGFRLLERRKLDDPARYVVRKAYADSATSATGTRRTVQLRQVDMFVRVSAESVVDVRMVFFADHYDPARQRINAVLDSFRMKK